MLRGVEQPILPSRIQRWKDEQSKYSQLAMSRRKQRLWWVLSPVMALFEKNETDTRWDLEKTRVVDSVERRMKRHCT